MRSLVASTSVMLPENGIVTNVWLVLRLFEERLTPLILEPAMTGLTAIIWRFSRASTAGAFLARAFEERRNERARRVSIVSLRKGLLGETTQLSAK